MSGSFTPGPNFFIDVNSGPRSRACTRDSCNRVCPNKYMVTYASKDPPFKQSNCHAGECLEARA